MTFENKRMVQSFYIFTYSTATTIVYLSCFTITLNRNLLKYVAIQTLQPDYCKEISAYYYFQFKSLCSTCNFIRILNTFLHLHVYETEIYCVLFASFVYTRSVLLFQICIDHEGILVYNLKKVSSLNILKYITTSKYHDIILLDCTYELFPREQISFLTAFSIRLKQKIDNVIPTFSLY